MAGAAAGSRATLKIEKRTDRIEIFTHYHCYPESPRVVKIDFIDRLSISLIRPSDLSLSLQRRAGCGFGAKRGTEERRMFRQLGNVAPHLLPRCWRQRRERSDVRRGNVTERQIDSARRKALDTGRESTAEEIEFLKQPGSGF